MKDFCSNGYGTLLKLSDRLRNVLLRRKATTGGATQKDVSHPNPLPRGPELRTTGASDISYSRSPVLLVHGIFDSAVSMLKMDEWLTSRGWPVYRISLFPNNGSAPLEILAEQLRDYVESIPAPGLKLNLVGFSMGGLVCRYYVQKLGGDRRVERVVTLSAPNRGTWLAHLSNKPACRQMRPGSIFLRALEADVSVFNRVRLVSIWTPLDLMILPSTSSRTSFARNQSILLPTHPLMILSRHSLRAVEAALAMSICSLARA